MKPLATCAMLLSFASLTGCTLHEEVGPPREVAYVEPGYYYDADYYDLYGGYHPAFYYYSDGRHYYHRDYVPRGYAYRPRPDFDAGPRGYRGAPRGGEPRPHFEGSGGGGGIGGRGRIAPRPR